MSVNIDRMRRYVKLPRRRYVEIPLLGQPDSYWVQGGDMVYGNLVCLPGPAPLVMPWSNSEPADYDG